ncbi:MAG: NAD-dependent epimerase/dehydratase family protein, partial [Verrucomicrobia bacterium]|nr:NAD-dependent epimerase/dehydratase family protein [Verrucomicrobiota bacterium]
MKKALVTGAAGLIGSESVRYFAGLGFQVVGMDNDLRAYFFGKEGSTRWVLQELLREVPGFVNHAVDIRDFEGVRRV